MLLLNNTSLKTIKLIALLFLNKNNKAQNLVLNGSFEQHTSTPAPNNCGNFLTQWTILDSPDYYINLCTTEGVPLNSFGYCTALSGNAYIGIATKKSPTDERKEYIQQQLFNPLFANTSYYASFYISKSDRTRLATEKIGALFSINQQTLASSTVCIVATPQVENHSGFLTDTVNWVKIEGYFKAQGGEQYITIGNFNSNANTDTLYTGTTNPFFADAGTAYYYIDSVSLYDSLDYVTNVLQIKNNISLSIFPNPTAGKLKVMLSGHPELDSGSREMLNQVQHDYKIKITDVIGREIKQLEYEEEIDISELEKGIYFLSIMQGNKTLVTKKVIKE